MFTGTSDIRSKLAMKKDDSLSTDEQLSDSYANQRSLYSHTVRDHCTATPSTMPIRSNCTVAPLALLIRVHCLVAALALPIEVRYIATTSLHQSEISN